MILLLRKKLLNVLIAVRKQLAHFTPGVGKELLVDDNVIQCYWDSGFHKECKFLQLWIDNFHKFIKFSGDRSIKVLRMMVDLTDEIYISNIKHYLVTFFIRKTQSKSWNEPSLSGDVSSCLLRPITFSLWVNCMTPVTRISPVILMESTSYFD